MNSAPHLLNEDRHEFARLLDEALRSAPHRRDPKDLTAPDGVLTTEQLRSMALSATALIAASAAAEYEHYIRLRGELRTPPRPTPPVPTRRRTSRTARAGRGSTTGRSAEVTPAPDTAHDPSVTADPNGTAAPDTAPDTAPDRAAAQSTDSEHGLDGAGSRDAVRGPGPGRRRGADRAAPARGPRGERGRRGNRAPGHLDSAEPTGAGLAAVIAVLAPVLAGAAALIFLLAGYVLEMIGPAPNFAHTLLTTGWVFGAITAAAILVAAAGLLLTALRNSATSLRADDRAELDAAVNRAREAWHQALLQRGILPFLQEALVTAEPNPVRTTRPRPTGRIPHLGYHSPGFSSPDLGTAPASRPRYSRPEFTSPDFGGPEHQPE